MAYFSATSTGGGSVEKIPIQNLKGHTYRVCAIYQGYTSEGYRVLLQFYYDDVLEYQTSVSSRSGTVTQTLDFSSGHRTDGSYDLSASHTAWYSSSYVHSFTVSLNGETLYSSGTVAEATNIDSGTKEIP